ncbi:MAG: XdhC family protein [Pseudoxanthomonas sp.]
MSSLRRVLEISSAAHQRGEPAVLAVVVETEGSTYVQPGAMALFGASEGQVGWLSGGCLEPEIETRARLASAQRRIEWMDIDTRDDEDLIGGSALGCRGRLRLALLPLSAMPGWSSLVAAWQQGQAPLSMSISSDGAVSAQVQALAHVWRIDAAEFAVMPDAATQWQLQVPVAPAVIVFGAGPETPTLLPLLRSLGWRTTLVERRARWQVEARLADTWIESAPESVLLASMDRHFDAALVMNHNFEMDREALHALASTAIPFIGLLGPMRRREDLFRVLPAAMHDTLLPRLHSPVGLKLGGHGPEAIALSIAAQLQAFRCGESGAA